MLNYLLDTNICIYVIKNRPAGILESFNRFASQLCISSITLAELTHGVERSSKIDHNRKQLNDFASRLAVLEYGQKAAIHYGIIRADLEFSGQIIGVNDLHIAKFKVCPNYPVVNSRCLVRLFQKYTALCPSCRPNDALYLTPLKNPVEGCWYSRVPIGHNKLADTVPRLMRDAGISGYFINHSLRATATTRMYDAQLDEASIMQRTGHRSVQGVRTYKRTTEKLAELTSTILNQNDKKVKMEKPSTIDTNEQKENVQQLCPSIPWNFDGATRFTINLNFK